MFQGDYATSEAQLRNIIDHSGDDILAAKASGQLLNNLSTNRRYEEAFALANRLTAQLGDIKDPLTRFMLLTNLSQMMNLAGQTDLAIQYARMAGDAIPSGESTCRPYYMEAAALYNGKRLKSTSPEIQRAVDACESAHQVVFTNATLLMLASIYLEEHQPAKALALMDRLEESIRASHYYPQMQAAHIERAQANEQLGNYADARKSALAGIGMSNADEVSNWLRDAYEVLYRVEKARGNNPGAIAYYERFVAQDKGYLDDVSARALAYEVAQQHMLMHKLETERLSKQNNILRLQQALDTKAMETSRLYIALLSVVLVSIVLWLFRVKRSQLRFKRLSRLDGLTGILNHQHFIGDAERMLRVMERKPSHACLIFIDLDHFKQVNDTHGHPAGDDVLRRTVGICQQYLRNNDVFGRLGGEEFGILLSDCPRERGLAMADSIRIAIQSSVFDSHGSMITTSASVGLASTDAFGFDLKRLCREADAALYRAKRTGRNRVMADTPSNGLVEA
ncbi:GGDEF domain-containing protein [Dyella terrae]|uniref:diguanylate cyclase n=3 Tax=Rhodanobacteraceae TaxID=1775411 RepID=A0A4R0YJE8_9GAMM|nr:GGDEF domain-containing protein [Dyella terrae]TCI06275.1 GGDEF domain-containing protein [Dyella soli]